MSTVKDRIEAEIVGLEIALECEVAVVAVLDKYDREWVSLRDRRDTPAPITLTRRVRQRLDSKHTVERLTQQIADLKAQLEVVRNLQHTFWDELLVLEGMLHTELDANKDYGDYGIQDLKDGFADVREGL